MVLPDKPLEGSGSLSDWMGRAGDLSLEAAPVCSHAQLSTHSKQRSARGASIPNLPLVSLPEKKVPQTSDTAHFTEPAGRLKRLQFQSVIEEKKIVFLTSECGFVFTSSLSRFQTLGLQSGRGFPQAAHNRTAPPVFPQYLTVPSRSVL